MFCRRMAARLACAAACLIASAVLAPSQAQTLTMRSALSRALAASPRLTAAERDIGIAMPRQPLMMRDENAAEP